MKRSVATLIDRGRLARALPFAAIAAAGQISAIWPPGPSNVLLFWVSTALLVLAAPLLFVRVPPGISPLLLPAVMDVVSVTLLMIATGGTGSGFGPLYLVAVVGMALFGSRATPPSSWCSCWSGSSSCRSRVAGQPWPPPVAWACSPGSAACFQCRSTVCAYGSRRRSATRSNSSVRPSPSTPPAHRLSSLLEPPAIAALGAELAAQTASRPGRPAASRYLRIEHDIVTVEARFGPIDRANSWQLDERSLLAGVIRELRPTAQAVGGSGGDEATSSGLPRHALLVPVAPGGCLHGVLEVVSPDGALTDESLERSVALGHLLELALSNWAAHEQLEQAGRAEERRRIARDLHDGLAHELAYIASMARSSRRAQAHVDVQELSSAADRALDEARRAITVLSAAAPQSLAGAVAQTAEDLGARLGVAVRLEVADDIDTRPDVTEHVLRIVREAITNAATHGGPDVVTVTVRKDDGVRVVVEDDGCGFDPEVGARSGFGLVSMRERADAIGAGFVVASAPSLGTRIELALP